MTAQQLRSDQARAGNYDLKIEWHSPDQIFVATFIRDGEPWYLDGALVGFGSTPGAAVTELLGIADHLVIEGENFLTNGPITLDDRTWLARLMDIGNDVEQIHKRYLAMREAGVTL